MHWFETWFKKFANPWVKFVLGAIVLSVLIFLFPSLFGEGYDTIGMLLNVNENPEKVMEGSLFYGGNILLYLGLVVLMKVFASTATNAGGGCGGIFAPSLFLGCLTGFIYGTIINRLSPGADISVQNFALLGMAGLMSGVMFAPLTGVFLIAELTGGYSMFLPLMMVSIMSYLTIKLFQPHSIYSMRLAQKGELMTHHKDQSVLLLMSMDNLIEKEFLRVSPDMDLGQLVNIIARSKRNLFPVVDDNDCLVGVVNMESIRNIMFRQELYHRFTVQKLMELPPARLSVKDPMETVMKKFDETGAWNLPVEDEEGHYLGFVSKSKIFNSYRNVLLELSEE
jgi:CIC family chloride channel protein